MEAQAIYAPAAPAVRQLSLAQSDASLFWSMDRILDKSGTRRAGLKRMAAYNRLQRIKGRRLKCNAHTRECFEALVEIYQSEARKLQQYDPITYANRLQGQEFSFYTNRCHIKAVMIARFGSDREAVSVRTISNQLERLAELGLIEKDRGWAGHNFRVCLSPRFLLLQSLQLCNISSKDTKKKNNTRKTVDVVQAVPACAQELPPAVAKSEVRSKSSIIHQETEAEYFAAQLWAQAAAVVYGGADFAPATVGGVQTLILTQILRLVAEFEADNQTVIAEHCASDSYRALKTEDGRLKRRAWLRKQLPNPTHRAYGILSRAISLQASTQQKKGFKPYHPSIYFSEEYGFERSIQYALKEDKYLRYSGKALKAQADAAIKLHITHTCTQTALALRRGNPQLALGKYEAGYHKLREMLAEHKAQFSREQMQELINQLKGRLQHIFSIIKPLK